MDRWKEALRRAGISEAVYEGQKLHSQYRFHVDDFGLIVGVRVWETTDGQFMGDCEYSVKGPSEITTATSASTTPRTRRCPWQYRRLLLSVRRHTRGYLSTMSGSRK